MGITITHRFQLSRLVTKKATSPQWFNEVRIPFFRDIKMALTVTIRCTKYPNVRQAKVLAEPRKSLLFRANGEATSVCSASHSKFDSARAMPSGIPSFRTTPQQPHANSVKHRCKLSFAAVQTELCSGANVGLHLVRVAVQWYEHLKAKIWDHTLHFGY
jgi:hypothetical protein